MPGVRIRPVDERTVPDNALVVLQDIARPFPPPRDGQRLENVQPVCRLCGVQHFHKTYHIQLEAGTAIVSKTIWDRLCAMVDNGGFELCNAVDNPPSQTIRM